jgi:hypothetical protein
VWLASCLSNCKGRRKRRLQGGQMQMEGRVLLWEGARAVGAHLRETATTHQLATGALQCRGLRCLPVHCCTSTALTVQYLKQARTDSRSHKRRCTASAKGPLGPTSSLPRFSSVVAALAGVSPIPSFPSLLNCGERDLLLKRVLEKSRSQIQCLDLPREHMMSRLPAAWWSALEAVA